MHLVLATDNAAGGQSMISILYRRWKELYGRLEDPACGEPEGENTYHEMSRISDAMARLEPVGREDVWKLLEVARVEGELAENNVQSRIIDGLLRWLRPEMGSLDLSLRPGQGPR